MESKNQNERNAEQALAVRGDDEEQFDAMLRELGAIETERGEAESFWQCLRPQLEQAPPRRLPFVDGWIKRPMWAFTGATAVVAAIVVCVAIWVRLPGPGGALGPPSRDVAQGIPHLYLPREYDPSLDLIVFKRGRVLAYEPATIHRDLKLFLGALETFASRLQWLAVSDRKIEIGLDSGETALAPRPVPEAGRRAGELLYFQIGAYHDSPTPTRAFVARVLALPGSSVRLEADSEDGARVRLSMTPRAPEGDGFPLDLHLQYDVERSGRRVPEIETSVTVEAGKPMQAGRLVFGKTSYIVYVTARRVSLEMAAPDGRV